MHLIRSPSCYKLANILRLITQIEFNHVTCILEVVTTLDCASLSGLEGPLHCKNKRVSLTQLRLPDDIIIHSYAVNHDFGM